MSHMCYVLHATVLYATLALENDANKLFAIILRMNKYIFFATNNSINLNDQPKS